MKYYSIDFIETMYAHFSNLLYDNPQAPPLQRAFWVEKIRYYLACHEFAVPISEITQHLPLTYKA